MSPERALEIHDCSTRAPAQGLVNIPGATPPTEFADTIAGQLAKLALKGAGSRVWT